MLPYALHLAVHESGHAIAAARLGFDPAWAEITMSRGGCSWFHAPANISNHAEAAIALAGPLACALVDDEMLDTTQALRRALERERESVRAEPIELSDEELERVAGAVRTILAADWENVATVAALLLDHGKIEF